jgi:hypothetical protein
MEIGSILRVSDFRKEDYNMKLLKLRSRNLCALGLIAITATPALASGVFNRTGA